MRLASFHAGGRPLWGLVLTDGYVDCLQRFPQYPTLKDAIAGDVFAQLHTLLDSGVAPDYAPNAVRLAPVIPDPGKILCIGLNYEEHRREVHRERSGYPTVFFRSPDSQTAHGEALLMPPESDMFDFEGEVAIIIGRRGRRIPAERALAHVAGYACYMDGSIRDFQRHTTQFHPGKNWPGTGSFGPDMVTADEIADASTLVLETRLNGAVVQRSGLDLMIFDIPELIAYCSIWTELRPGDVIVTGTPGGVGSGRKPPLWMKPGDIIEVVVEGVGHLTNRVEREQIGQVA